MMELFLPRSARLKHKLLKILLDKTLESKNKTVGIEERSIPVKDVANMLGVTLNQLSYLTPDLLTDGYIIVGMVNNVKCLYSGAEIATAFYSKKYLKEGRKDFNDSIYDVAKWAMPLMLFIITVFTTYINWYLSKENKRTKQDIQQIQKELDSLTNQVRIKVHT